MEVEKDYLAICFIMAGSCFGRAATKEAAIETCRKEANAFAKAFGGFKAEVTDLKVNVYDATGYDSIVWDDFGVRADGRAEPLGPPEVVTINPHKKFKPT